MNSRPLTKKQTAFRDAILSGFTPTQAYKKAFDAKAMGPRTIAEEARKLLRDERITKAITLAVKTGTQPALLPPLAPKVRLSMEERLDVMEAAVRVDPAEYFDDLNHFLPIKQMPKHVRMAIAGFKVDPLSFVTEVKFVDRIQATRLYSQLAGDMPKDKGPLPPSAPRRQFDLSKLTDEEFKEHLRLRKKATVTSGEQTT